MRTPDEFIQVLNDRKTDGGSKSRRRKPSVIIVTVILALFMLVVGGNGVLQLTLVLGKVLQSGGFIFAWMVAFVRALVIAVVAVTTLYACFKRPRWGRVVSIAFAVVFIAMVADVATTPDPHPVFPIAPGPEQAGVYVGDLLMACGILVYAWAMILGAKAKAYFAGQL